MSPSRSSSHSLSGSARAPPGRRPSSCGGVGCVVPSASRLASRFCASLLLQPAARCATAPPPVSNGSRLQCTQARSGFDPLYSRRCPHRHTQYDGRFWGDEDRDSGAYLDCRDDPSMVLILTVLVVCTTVIINGVTMPALMSYLKTTEVTPERRHMLADAVRYSRKSRVSNHHTPHPPHHHHPHHHRHHHESHPSSHIQLLPVACAPSARIGLLRLAFVSAFGLRTRHVHDALARCASASRVGSR